MNCCQMVVVRMFTSLNVIVDSRMNRTLKAFQSKAWGRDEVAHPRIVIGATCMYAEGVREEVADAAVATNY